MRVFPLSNWTELDVWEYIRAENIPVVPLYFSKSRPVGQRLVETSADAAAGGLELALDEEPHGQRRRVPAAGREPAENRFACSFIIKVEGLRIELSGEGLDLFGVDSREPAAVHGLISAIAAEVIVVLAAEVE